MVRIVINTAEKEAAEWPVITIPKAKQAPNVRGAGMKLSLVRAKKGEEEGDGEDDDDPSRGDSEGDMVFPRLALAAWDALCLFVVKMEKGLWKSYG